MKDKMNENEKKTKKGKLKRRGKKIRNYQHKEI